jgi:hypothetical protein
MDNRRPLSERGMVWNVASHRKRNRNERGQVWHIPGVRVFDSDFVYRRAMLSRQTFSVAVRRRLGRRPSPATAGCRLQRAI